MRLLLIVLFKMFPILGMENIVSFKVLKVKCPCKVSSELWLMVIFWRLNMDSYSGFLARVSMG